MRNYYLEPKKYQLGYFVDLLKIFGQLNFLFHGLVLEIWENSEIFYYDFKEFSYYKIYFEIFFIALEQSIFHYSVLTPLS